MSKPEYKVPKGLETQVQVLVTKKNGQEMPAESVEYYDPSIVDAIFNQRGFEGQVLNDPRPSAQKTQKVSSTTVKAQQLDTDEDYKQRYAELFKHVAPLNFSMREVRAAVDAAEAKLPEILAGAKVVNELVFLPMQGDVLAPVSEAGTAEDLGLTDPVIHDGPTDADAPSSVAPPVVKTKGK